MLHNKYMLTGLLAGGCLAAASVSPAAVTVNGTGSYATIGQALSNASANAVLEITDSATYSENVYITLDGITIRAASGQTPTIAGISAAHPVTTTSMPVKWHGGGQDTTFNTNGAAIVNDAMNVTLQGLIINAGAADGALDLRFGTASVLNSTINASGKVAAVLTLGDQTLNTVTINGGNDSIISQGAGTLTIANSTITGTQRAARFLGGTVNATNSQFIESGAVVGYGVHVGNTFGASSASFDHVVFRSDATATGGRGRILLVIDGSGTAGQNYPGGQWGDGLLSLTANHCDFIAPKNASTGDFLDNHAINMNTGRIGWITNNITVTNSNFYGQVGSPINIGGAINEPNAPGGIRPDEIHVDYNYFYKTRNNIHDQCDVLGNYGWCAENKPNNVQSWGPWHPLYVNADAGNFQVASNSPAATAASNGGPTGALGVSTTAATFTEHTVAKSGTPNFSTIQAAYDAASNGDVITILDSATYNENLTFSTKKDIYLRAAPSLTTKPVISGTSAQPYTLLLSSGSSQRVTIVGLAFDGSNLPTGARSCRFEDAGQSAVIDCSFTTANSTDWCMYVTGTRGRIFSNCTVQHQTPGYGAVLQGGGLVDFENCTFNSTVSGAGFFVMNGPNIDVDNLKLTSVGPSFEHRRATVDIRNSHLKSGALQVMNITSAANNNLFAFSTIFECTGKVTAPAEQWGIATRAAAAGDATLVIDNCDIYGGPQGTVGVWMRNDGDRATIKDTIVSKFSAFAFHDETPNDAASVVYGGRAATYGDPGYNVLVDAPDGLGVAGPNSVIRTSPVALYVDAPADFHLSSNSIARNVNSFETPTYAGSQGLTSTAPPAASAADWALFH